MYDTFAEESRALVVVSARLADHAENRRYMNKKIERLRDAGVAPYTVSKSPVSTLPARSRLVVMVLLDEDVFAHFKDAATANEALRRFIRERGIPESTREIIFEDLDDDLLPHYDFSNGVRGAYFDRSKLAAFIRLDADVSAYLDDASAVNDALRELIAEGRRR